jgi:hypothetical protein
MPTAAKLIAALAFGVVVYLAALAFVPGLPEGTPIGRFPQVAGAMGLLCGWAVMGAAVGRGGYGTAVLNGWRTSLTAALALDVLFSVSQMVELSTRGRYDNPMRAILGTFELAVDYLLMAMTWPVLGILLAGGAIGGILAEMAHRRWR